MEVVVPMVSRTTFHKYCLEDFENLLQKYQWRSQAHLLAEKGL